MVIKCQTHPGTLSELGYVHSSVERQLTWGKRRSKGDNFRVFQPIMRWGRGLFGYVTQGRPAHLPFLGISKSVDFVHWFPRDAQVLAQGFNFLWPRPLGKKSWVSEVG